MPDLTYLRQRDRLVELLAQAAELEHTFCCQYLYAAFSLKQDASDERTLTPEQLTLVQGWKGSLLLIARQEMVHLAMVCNLLSALGEPPQLGRPDFPIAETYYPFDIRLDLAPFDERFLETAIKLEEPQDRDPEFELGELYEQAQRLLTELGTTDPSALLLSPRTGQVDNSTFLPSYPDVRRSMRPMFEMLISKVQTVPDAVAALTKVRSEGEGSATTNAIGHYQMLNQMLTEYRGELDRDPLFHPSRAVVSNPWVEGDDAVSPRGPHRATLTNPVASAMAEAFNLGYEIMLKMLILCFTRNPLTQSGFRALQNVAFQPCMSLVLRPMGEMLTLLPAAGSDGMRAGAPFRCPRRVQQLPQADAAWTVLAGQLLQLHGRIAQLEGHPDIPSVLKPRVTMLRENTWRMHDNFTSMLGAE